MQEKTAKVDMQAVEDGQLSIQMTTPAQLMQRAMGIGSAPDARCVHVLPDAVLGHPLSRVLLMQRGKAGAMGQALILRQDR